MTETALNSVVIAGGGQAAASTVMALRQGGYEGAITLVGAEPVPPYQRPPLSKAYMKGELGEERLYFKPSPWYEDNGIDLVLATRATGIDREARRLSIEHGGHVDYDALVIATGARPRRLPVPGADLAGVYDLRSLADVERIQPNLIDGRRLVIVGAGYIGLEAASSAKSLGLDVTVLEYAPRILARVTSPPISEFYEREHRRHGVDIRTGARLVRLNGDGVVTSAELADGERIDADLVLVGIGVVPNQELAQDAGIACDDGIVVDRDARAADPNVFAAGDCTQRPLVHYGRHGRLESVHNAIEQGKIAAAAILGRPRPTEDCPWFWSDQYDVKLQIAGLSGGYDQLVTRGDPDERRFAVFYLREERLIAVDAVNSPAEFMLSKKLIVAAAEPDPAEFADASVPMKTLASRLL
ncbi:MAG: FAD-dependent oxidoreductase [Pseudomonadota bacterium]